MAHTRRDILGFSVAALTPALLARPARAVERVHPVGMWTEGGKKFYDPAFLRVRIGDIVQFINISGSHNTESIAGMIPDGVPAWNSTLKETFDLRITQPGVYGYKCTPHYTKAMVGLIVAGDPSVNLEAARAVRHRGPAREEFDRLFARI